MVSSLYSLTALDGSMAISALARKVFFQFCRPITGLSVQIHELPADQRRTENVKYGYVTTYKTPTN
jgi:hypothetical protein